jgi:hypothetical protein
MCCDICGRNFDFVKLEDGSFMCASCLSNAHIIDDEGRCWCNPDLEIIGNNRIWIHNRMS